MASGLDASMWSRETTAESTSGKAWPKPEQEAAKTSASAVASDATALGRCVVTKRELEELLVVSVRGLPFAVTIAESSAQVVSPVIRAVSRGVEELYELSRQSLLGQAMCFLDVPDQDLDAAAKLLSARKHGATAAVVQTHRRASGEHFKVYQYHRGLRLGSDLETMGDVWYLLTVSFDITAEFVREVEGNARVDYDFYTEAAIASARQVRQRVTNAMAAMPVHRRDAIEREDDESMYEEFAVECEPSVSIASPEWVECPPESTDVRRP